MNRRRPGFRPGMAIRLADGQSWTLPEPASAAEHDSLYEALLSAICEADDRPDLLRAELALGIHLISENYDFPPRALGALLDFPPGDPALAQLQGELHRVAIEHIRAYRPRVDPVVTPPPAPRILRRFGFFGRARASMSA